LVGIGSTVLWSRRSLWLARVGLAAALAATAVWGYVLLERTPKWNPWLAPAVLLAGLALAVLLVMWSHLPGPTGLVVAALALVVALAGPTAYTLATVTTAHSGAIPSAGPTNAGGGPGGFAGAGGGRGFGGGGGGGGAGSLLNASTPSAAVTTALGQGSASYTWVAAAVGADNAAGYQLATSKAVMAIGGFNGTDPAPSLAQFERDVAAGKIHYFIAGGGTAGGPGGTTSSVASTITSWVEQHFSSQTVGGTTLYDLTARTSVTSAG